VTKRTLGKIIFLLFILTVNSLYAEPIVSLSSPVIYRGDSVDVTITADGKSIEFPDISEIEGFAITGTSTSESINIINGSTTRTKSQNYHFRPTKSITIPSFKVRVDGKDYKTNPLELKVAKPVASKNGSPFVLEMKLDKKEAYVGEVVDLTIAFKRRIDANAQKLQLGDPKLESFWVKKVDDVEHSQEGEYVIQRLHYKLFPQKAGEFTIPALEALVGQMVQRQQRRGFFDDPFFGRNLSWQKIYSAPLTLNVKALPSGLELYGNYKISATVDKKSITANKPVNLTIKIEGEGNIDDIKKFDPTVNHALVYADEPEIQSALRGDIYYGTATQKVAIIADQNFTIPSLSLSYFDKATKSKKTITTEPIKIEVIGGTIQQSVPSSIEMSSATQKAMNATNTTAETKIIIKKEDEYIKYLFLLLGVVLGAGSVTLFYFLKNRTSKVEHDMVKAIKKAKGDKALFELLLPYSKEGKVVSDTLNLLESNLYKGANNVIDREGLMEFFEEESVV
jgi:hypothetical protein